MPRTEKKIVHVVGTGTIGEPLIVLLAGNKKELGIDEVTFSKFSPRLLDRPKVANLISRGAHLALPGDKMEEFAKMGIKASYEFREAIARASVVIDCTSAGNKNKDEYYKNYESDVLGFLAQGSEKNFGKPYAFSITDASLEKSDKYLWIVSCNTHNISTIVWTIALNFGAKNPSNLLLGDFTILRRASDINQANKDFIASPEVAKHDDEICGTHQAEDAKELFKKTLGMDLNLFSSALKANTQYMHVMRFCLHLKERITKEEVIRRIARNPLIAVTEKLSTSNIFSFGRDQGHCGRILNQTVVPAKTITVVGRRVVGFCFTPQDGNSLLSSTAASLYFLHPADYLKKMEHLARPPFIFKEV